MSLDAVEFLRRFALHVLPKGFVRIRSLDIINVPGRVVQHARKLSLRLGSGHASTKILFDARKAAAELATGPPG